MRLRRNRVLTEQELLAELEGGELDKKTRPVAIRELRKVATIASLPAVRRSLTSSDPAERVLAVGVLFELRGEREATALMCEALASEDKVVAQWAAIGLEWQRVHAPGVVPPEAVTALIGALRERGTKLGRKTESILTGALGVFRDPRAIETLTAAAMRPNRKVRRAGLRGLARLQDPAAASALESVREQLSRRDAKYLRYRLRLSAGPPSK